MQQPRRHRLWFYTLAAGSIALAVLLVATFKRAGLEEADKIASVVAALLAFAGLLAPLLVWLWRRTDSTNLSTAENPLQLEALLLHVRNGSPPLIKEVDLLSVGVKKAIDAELDGDADLPPYVARDGDQDLAWAISQGGLVVLHGRAAAGKSRSAYEVVRRLRPEAQLVVPAKPRALQELTDSGFLFSNVVIWLDDIERFLGSDGLTPELVNRIAPNGRTDVVVLATVRDAELARIKQLALKDIQITDNAHGYLDHAAVRLVASIGGQRLVSVSQYLSPEERKGAVQHRSDPRIAAALETKDGWGFGEYLAAGPALMERWSVGDGALYDVGQALISAAVDCRRAGYDEPVSRVILDRLFRYYMSPSRALRNDVPSVEDGLTWACESVLGASSCLIPHTSQGYKASDYLTDRTQSGEGLIGDADIRDEVYETLYDIGDPDEVATVATQASFSGKNALAERGYRVAATRGGIGGVVNLPKLLLEQGRIDEAEAHWKDYAEQGWPDAMAQWARICEYKGDLEGAKFWFARAAIEGEDPTAMNELAQILESEGDSVEAERLYRMAIAVPEIAFIKCTDAMRNLARLLAEQNRNSSELEEAAQLSRRANYIDVRRKEYRAQHGSDPPEELWESGESVQ